MLKITIPGESFWDERTEQFTSTETVVLELEYSLLALSEWESKWHKPWLEPAKAKTVEETLDFIRCMTLNKGLDPAVYQRLTRESMAAIQRYMEDPMTATTFKPRKGGKKRARYQTAETIYSSMCSYGIPFSCETWHLNRLLTLIRACGEDNAPPEKMGRAEQMARQRELNAARRAKLRTKG